MKDDVFTMMFLLVLVACAGLLGIAMLADGLIRLICWLF